MRPLTPQALGSHALLVAVHLEGADVVLGADRLLLTGDGVVLVPTSSSYCLESRGCDLKLLVVMGTRLDESALVQGSEHAVPVGQEQPTGEEQQQSQPEVAGEEVDVQAIVAAALTRFTAAARPPPTTEALEEEDQRRRGEEAQVAMERDQEPEFMGTREAQRESGPRGLGVADKAGPKTGEVETCRHRAKGWCMRADACRFAQPQPPVPRGVPQELLLILQAMARLGPLSLDRSQGHGRGHRTLLREVVVKAQGGGLPAVGYAVESGGLTEWALALPCGMAALLTPFPQSVHTGAQEPSSPEHRPGEAGPEHQGSDTPRVENPGRKHEAGTPGEGMECAGQHQGEETAAAGGKGDRRGRDGATAEGKDGGRGGGGGAAPRRRGGDSGDRTKRGRKEGGRSSGARIQLRSTPAARRPVKRAVVMGSFSTSGARRAHLKTSIVPGLRR